MWHWLRCEHKCSVNVIELYECNMNVTEMWVWQGLRMRLRCEYKRTVRVTEMWVWVYCECDWDVSMNVLWMWLKCEYDCLWMWLRCESDRRCDRDCECGCESDWVMMSMAGNFTGCLVCNAGSSAKVISAHSSRSLGWWRSQEQEFLNEMAGDRGGDSSVDRASDWKARHNADAGSSPWPGGKKSFSADSYGVRTAPVCDRIRQHLCAG